MDTTIVVTLHQHSAHFNGQKQRNGLNGKSINYFERACICLGESVIDGISNRCGTREHKGPQSAARAVQVRQGERGRHLRPVPGMHAGVSDKQARP